MKINNRFYILYALAVLNFLHIVDSMIIMPLGDIFITEFNLTSTQYSLLVSGYALAAFFSSLIGVFYMDRFDRKNTLILIFTGFGIGTIACAQANSYLQLLALRFATGFFGGIVGAMMLSIISDLFKFKERGQAMGVLFGSLSAATALGVPIGLFFAAKANWQLPFMVIGILALLFTVIIYFVFPPMTTHLESQDKKLDFLKTIKNITSDYNQLNALLAGFVLVMAHFMIIPFITPYLIKNVGLTQMEITYQFFFGGAATIVTSPIIGKLTDKVGVMKVFTAVMVISFIPTIIITNLQVVPLAVALTYTTMFFVFGSGRMISPNTLITAAAGTKNRGSFMSIKSALQQLAIGITSIISGLIVTINKDTNLYENYYLTGIGSIILGVLAIYLVSRIKVADGN